ncbi:hypothetical protein [Sphingobacterium sp. HMA12]|uniref:hypothetical protein n=1 Tax=Sphingobacterium sp. HMA12 TaxID=2050894 RepID=UPI0013159D13|nr:hypothetical protein [Sphingobacterium sp. HMA12]
MSNARLSLIATCLHIVVSILLFNYMEQLSRHDLDGIGIFLIFLLVVLALIFAIKSRLTTLGLFLLFVNSVFLLIWLVLLYFALTFTFKV